MELLPLEILLHTANVTLFARLNVRECSKQFLVSCLIGPFQTHCCNFCGIRIPAKTFYELFLLSVLHETRSA